MSYPVPIEAGKPNPGYGGARTLFNDLRDCYPETYKHLKGRLRAKGGGAGFMTQEELIEEAKQKKKANAKPLTEEEIEAKERERKITMLRHKQSVGGRRNPAGGFYIG